MGVMEISAVFSGIVISRLGEGKTCILGAGLAGLGLLLSSFSSGRQHARESVRKRCLHVLRIYVYIHGIHIHTHVHDIHIYMYEYIHTLGHTYM